MGIQPKGSACPVLPLEYMLAVLNDETAPAARRDRMAIAAAPYVHARVGDQRLGKREAAQLAAQTAGEGTGWDGLLDAQPTPTRRLPSSSWLTLG